MRLRVVEELARHVRGEPGQHDVLAEPFEPLRAPPVDEAGPVEVVALLLAAAAVGDDEGATPLELDEVEEAQPRDRAAAVAPAKRRARPKRSIAATVTEWSTKSSGVVSARVSERRRSSR